MPPAHPDPRPGAWSPGVVFTFLLVALLLPLAAARPGLTQCSLPDLPSCECFDDCSAVGAPWPPALSSDIIEIARATVGLRSCCIQHGGQAYWQVQKQATNPPCAEALAFQQPGIENDEDTNPEAWCTETIAYWAARAATPYAQGFFTQRHHPSSYVRSAGEMRQWYTDEEAFGGLYRGRWIDGSELDCANFEPGVNGPCPGAYQQIYLWEPADTDGDGTPWNNTASHSQLVDSMVVYRLDSAEGPVQRIDLHMTEGNVGLGGGSIYSRVTDSRWYRDIVHFTALGADDEVLDGIGRKIRGWGINLNSDGTPEYDPGRITTVVTLLVRDYPAPSGPENSDAGHVAQMLSFFAATGGNVAVSSNSTLVSTGGALPTPTSPWAIPQGPHPVDPVYIEIDLLAEHPTPVSAVTIDWVGGPPTYFEVWWSGVPVQIMKRFVTVPSGGPTVPPGTTVPFTVALNPSTTGAAFPVRYARLYIPNTSLTRTFLIRGFHFHFQTDVEEDAGGSSPPGDAIATGIGDGQAPESALRLSAGAPNPFAGATSLWFEMPAAGQARLAVYDLRGQLVRTLVDGGLDAGRHDVEWDRRDDDGGPLPAGVYFARLTAFGAAVTRKLVLIH